MSRSSILGKCDSPPVPDTIGKLCRAGLFPVAPYTAGRWTLEEACLENLITGGTGSGKTNGPFQYIIRSFLRAGCGGIFLCAKKDAVKDYRKIIESEHREQDLAARNSGQDFSTAPGDGGTVAAIWS